MAKGPKQGQSRREGWLLVSRWLAANVDPTVEGARGLSTAAVRRAPIDMLDGRFARGSNSTIRPLWLDRARVHNSWWDEPPRDSAREDFRWLEVLDPTLLDESKSDALDRGRRSRLRRLLVSDFPTPPLRRNPDDLAVQILDMPRKRLYELVNAVGTDDILRTFDPASLFGSAPPNAPDLFTALDATFSTTPRQGEIAVGLPAIGLRVLAIPFSQRPSPYAEALARRFEKPAGRCFLRANKLWRQFGVPAEYDEYEWISRHLGESELLGDDFAGPEHEQES